MRIRLRDGESRAEAIERTYAFWQTENVASVPLLQELYDLVLQHSEKRMPRWKFRLAPDLIVQVQPEVTRHGRRFAVAAMLADGLTGKHFSVAADQRPQPWLRLSGVLVEATPDRPWSLRFTGLTWSPKHPHHELLRDELRARVFAAFRDGRFDRSKAAQMLDSFCLICGKALTDPVSQARFIGPECAGTASVDIPWIQDASAPADVLYTAARSPGALILPAVTPR